MAASHERLAKSQESLTATVERLAIKMETLTDFTKEVAALQIGQDSRIRRLESHPPPAA